MIRNFEDLFVWKKGHAFILEIYKLTKQFPSDERFGLRSQIQRSSVSICANIAEGNKKSTKDYLRFLNIALGSLEESRYHLILSKDLGYCNVQQFNKLYSMLDEIGKMLNGLMNSLQR